jgi:DNA-binding beta-propeller fold protein YncE
MSGSVGTGFIGSTSARRVGLLSVLLLAALLLSSTSAHALSQQGHVFTGTLGTMGSGNGQLLEPSAVAVSEATGDVYVADRGNARVEILNAKGEFVSLFENAKGAKIGRVEALAVDNSHLANPAEDPSAGDVYIVQKGSVLKYDAQGKFLATVIAKEQKEEFGAPQGVAVDPHGQVWIDFAEDEILTFDDGQPNLRVGESLASELEPLRGGLAVDSNENLYVRYEPAEESEEGAKGCNKAPCFVGVLTTIEEPIHELSPGEPLVFEIDRENTSGVAVDPANNDSYLDNLGSIAAFTPAGALIQRFGTGNLQEGTGVAVDSKTNTVYVADAGASDVAVFAPAPAGPPTVDSVATQSTTASSAKLEAQIDPVGADTTYTLQYSTTQCTATPSACAASFSCGSEASVCGEVPASPVDIGSGFGAQPASAEATGLSPNTVYYYRFVAKNANGVGANADQSFLTRPASGLMAADAREWELVSPPDKFGNSIEPIRLEGGVVQASTTGTALTYVANGPVEANPQGNRSPEPTQVLSTRDPVSGWSSHDIATPNNEASGITGGAVGGEYRAFSPNLSLSIDEPFNKAKLASPPLSPLLTEREKTEGQEKTIYARADAPISPEAAVAQIYAEARANGVALSNPGYVALVNDLNAPGVKLESVTFEPALRFAGVTPDLAHMVIASRVALTGPERGVNLTKNHERLYEWSAGQLQEVSVLPAGETAVGTATLGLGDTDVRHAISDDGSRIFWESGAPQQGGPLYMRDTQTQTTVRVDAPDSEEVAIKENGFPGGGAPRAIYQLASADGSRVFFTDPERLVEGAKAVEGKPDLYVYDVASGKLTDLTIPPPPASKKATPESANVREVALGAGEGGSQVYFVANGVLDSRPNAHGEKATPGECTNESSRRRVGTCSLYTARFNGSAWESPRFIATLSSEDGPNWETAFAGEEGIFLRNHTSGTSPDGNYLTFMSDRPLTGYDNTDLNSGQQDEEVFLYNASTEGLLCASCNPTGSRPLGVHDVDKSGEGVGLLVDRPGSWEEHEGEEHPYSSWLAGSIPGWTEVEPQAAYYQSNYLSNSGRLFFNSPDALAPQDKNGKEDVYEYEPEGVPKGQHMCSASATTFSSPVHGCIGLISSGSGDKESAFLDASVRGGEEADGKDGTEGGGDAFFLTASPIAVQDSDTTFDAYDAHECTTETPCLPPPTPPAPPCKDEESCKTGFVPAGSPPSPSNVTGGGNVSGQTGVLSNKTTVISKKPVVKPLTRPQKLSKALKACKKLKKKAKRTACEKQARKKYGPKAKSKSKSKKAKK